MCLSIIPIVILRLRLLSEVGVRSEECGFLPLQCLLQQIGEGLGIPLRGSHPFLEWRVGVGVGLSWREVGVGIPLQSFKTQSACTHITLKDILLVLSITKNLINISKLTVDNNLPVEFFYMIL